MAWTTPKTWATLEALTSVDMNAQVKDNITYLKNRAFVRTIDVDGTVSTSNTTSFSDITGASATLTTSADSRLLVLAHLTGSVSSGIYGYVTLDLDGTNLGDTNLGLSQTFGVGTAGYQNISIPFLTSAAVSNGSHTVKLRYRVSTAANNFIIYQFGLYVFEVL